MAGFASKASAVGKSAGDAAKSIESTPPGVCLGNASATYPLGILQLSLEVVQSAESPPNTTVAFPPVAGRRSNSSTDADEIASVIPFTESMPPGGTGACD